MDKNYPAKCKGCGAQIFWQRTKAGKLTPADPDGTSHWATCPKVAMFKKPEKEPERKGDSEKQGELL